MRIVLSLTALLLTTGAAQQNVSQTSAPVLQPPQADDASEKFEMDCRYRVTPARDAEATPRFLSETASPDEPLFIYAVDKRISDCPVIVMHGNVNDIRPLPSPTEPRMMRAQ